MTLSELRNNNNTIQIGIIAYRNPTTNQFDNAKPLLHKITPELKDGYKNFSKEVSKFFIDDCCKYYANI